MIGNLWFALLAFVLGAGLTYLRMAGSATRQVAKPVPRRLVMGGLIPGVVDPPQDALPSDVGPEWQIRVGSAASAPSAATPDDAPPAESAEVEADPAPAVDADAPALPPLEPPWPVEDDAARDETPAEAPVPDGEQPAADPASAAEPSVETEPSVAVTTEPSAPLERKIAAGATDEPPTSSWWAAAFDRGDPGPYPGPLRYASAWPPVGSRVLDVDDEFAAAWGAGAAASAASAALFGTAGHAASAAEPVESLAPEKIKGNRDSMLYHTPDSPWYARTKAEAWFATEDEAQAAGFARWDSRTRGRQG
ncbi:hypothetical protein ATK74_2441 [Propionicimonas paludicola]|uniref:Uncharacterized protein n=1 Tax=Propionicimonas paludicola TaxID=185243 RepID=A0A2A9CTW3_9ACTN|nr:hypothetical protein [Propionicimonas paludicola]PFG17864.1 hypothetical protein ATK74_2441 [Propionicimonas paludicola]